MTPVDIDISDFISQWKLSVEQADIFSLTLLDQISLRFANEWRAQASEMLGQTRQVYSDAIYIEKIDNYNVVVGLKGWLPNAVEQGISAFDQKSGFSRSNKKHPKKDGGWYLTIPFRFATPTAIAESSIFSQILPNKVYQVAKTELTNSKRQLTVSQLPKEFQNLGIRPEVSNKGTTYQAYQHKSPIFAGMQRIESEGSQKHGQYVTFRRVSDLSDPNAWIHTGIQAYNLAGKTLSDFDIANVVANTKLNFIDSLNG